MIRAGAAIGSVPALCGEQSLCEWIGRQYSISAALMLRAISATHLVKERRGFGQTIRPARGSILASTAIGSWDPDPDYFFHWQRDSAIVIDALRHLISDGTHAAEGLAHCNDYVAFSHALNRLDGSNYLRLAGDFRTNVDPWFLQFVREDNDLQSITGDRVLGEPRFNPDATLDISKWSRPQHDGPALRTLALIRLFPLDGFGEAERALMRALIVTDLGFILRHWREPCFDIWEEELGHHYSTRLLHHAALAEGVSFLEASSADKGELAQACCEAAQESAESLDEYWCQDKGFYVSRRGVANAMSGRELDFATILAVIRAGLKSGGHSVLDPKVMATLAWLEKLFEASYPINHGRPENLGPAMGRYADDHYFSGGAYYFSTLGAAEFYYMLAAAIASGADLPVTADNRDFLQRFCPLSETRAYSPQEQWQHSFDAFLRRGDQFMAAVAAYTPASGELSEQFDQKTSAQTSAKTLTWSHAAFITAAARRKAAVKTCGHKLSQFLAAP
jgi:glucoamylase